MSDLDPECFTLRQAAQVRDDFAQVMGELEFVKTQPALLPTRRDQAFVPLKIMFGSAVIGTHSSFFGWKRSGGIPSRSWSWGCLAAVVVALPPNTASLVSDS
jgi:hypothetical protein